MPEEWNRLKRHLFRIILLFGSLTYLVVLSVSVAGQWLLNHPTRENLERGIRWDSRNPALWARYARLWHFLPNSQESQQAVEAYRRAASLNPLDPGIWKELSNTHLERREPEMAEAALRAELAAVPHSPQASWRLANFLLVQGRTNEAFPYLRTAATHEPSLRVPVFDLAWKLQGDPEVILRELVPADTEARADYLQFLLGRRRLTEAYPVWTEVSRTNSPAMVRLGNSYAEVLATAGMGTEAARVWKELLSITGRTDPKPSDELLTNGDFEANISNAGLDWRLTKGPGYQTDLDAFTFQNGTRSLRVTFDGTANAEFAGVWQAVPVEPNRKYRFQGHLKTDSITTDNGLFFILASLGAPREETFAHSTESRVETNGWVREQLDFQTGPRTSVIVIQLRRYLSRKLNNLLQGRAWIDNLSVKPREP